jgi:hypothetical protein
MRWISATMSGLPHSRTLSTGRVCVYVHVHASPLPGYEIPYDAAAWNIESCKDVEQATCPTSVLKLQWRLLTAGYWTVGSPYCCHISDEIDKCRKGHFTDKPDMDDLVPIALDFVSFCWICTITDVFSTWIVRWQCWSSVSETNQTGNFTLNRTIYVVYIWTRCDPHRHFLFHKLAEKKIHNRT